jgi:hypothetical protein
MAKTIDNKQVYRGDSFIRNDNLIDNKFLGLNDLPKITATLKDESYIISPLYDERPDLLAYAIYDNTRLWWVFSLRNPDILKDPIRDFKAGTKIILPSKSSVNALSK